jgi:hypothetical protein
LAKLFFAPLTGKSSNGMGLYDETGKLLYYSDGGDWFFEVETGKPSFYAADGALFLPDGKPLSHEVL